MGLSKRRRGFAAVAIAAVAVLAAASACNSDSSGSTESHEQIKLVVDVFGDQGFGYESLYERYMRQHPNIKIEERGKGFNLGDYNTRLTQWMSSGNGAGDIVAIEEGTLLQFKAQPQQFVNLFDYGAGTLEPNFLQWKWNQGMTLDGKQLIGLGTDIGSLAICYRKDLFEKARLPIDRESVAGLWPTWEAFINTGKQFTAASAINSSNTKFVDASTNFFGVVLMQLASAGTGYMYFDTNNKRVIDSNPDVKAAWQFTVEMINWGSPPTCAHGPTRGTTASSSRRSPPSPARPG
jgi:cellobiose transport system substrate-binding protein